MLLPTRSTSRVRTLSLMLAMAASSLLYAGRASAQSPVPTSDDPVTVIIVRHAERAADPQDPPIDSIGRVRAAALAEALADAGVDAIYVTQYRRTRETAEPLARRLGLTMEVIPASSPVPAHASTVARTVLAKHRGQTVLVVGHSNTIGMIARGLGVTSVPAELADHEYEHLWIVTTDGSGSVRFISARYGPPNPTPK